MTDFTDIAFRIAVALACGALIGVERQWRSRTAGLRTNALVSLGAALFVVMGTAAFPTAADHVAVPAQIVSGIGFLGAGVIMKQGASISGLNTAATLWATAAVGASAGAGLVPLAVGGTLLVMLANTLLRPLGRVIDSRTPDQSKESTATEYRLDVRCPLDAEQQVRALVFEAVQRPAFTVREVGAADDGRDGVLISAVVHIDERDDREIEQALAAVVRTPAVTGVKWSAIDLAAVD